MVTRNTTLEYSFKYVTMVKPWHGSSALGSGTTIVLNLNFMNSEIRVSTHHNWAVVNDNTVCNKMALFPWSRNYLHKMGTE